MTLPALSPIADEGAVVGFNYESLEPAEADAARAAAERIRDRVQAGVIEVGQELNAIKDTLGHGAFGAWIKAEFQMTDRTANNYMRAATVFSGNSEIVSIFPLTTIYDLAAQSTPETVRNDVLRQVAEGHRPKPAEIAETIRQAKQEERARQDAEREAERLAKMTDEERTALEAKAKRQRRTRAQREAEEARSRADMEAKDRRQAEAAQEVAELLAERFGNDLDRLMTLIKETQLYRVQNAVAELASQRTASETAE